MSRHKARKKHKKRSEAQQHLEQAYDYEEKREFQDALRECKLAIQLAPGWAEPHNLRGMVLDGLGRKEEAIVAYQEAVCLDPAFREAHENLLEAEAELMNSASDRVPIKAGIAGVLTGITGAVIGALPFGALHYALVDLVVGIFGSYSATPDVLLFLVAGVPLPFFGIFYLPIGGAIFGLVGAIIGVRRYYKRELNSNKQKVVAVAASWGAVFGLMFNVFVSFWAQ